MQADRFNRESYGWGLGSCMSVPAEFDRIPIIDHKALPRVGVQWCLLSGTQAGSNDNGKEFQALVLEIA